MTKNLYRPPQLSLENVKTVQKSNKACVVLSTTVCKGEINYRIYNIILLLEYTIYYIIHIQYTTEQNTEQKSTERIKTKPNKATTTQNPAESQPETCACLCVCGTFYAFISALPAQ